MNLFFEKEISRRNFLKKCGWLAASGYLISKVVKFAEAQEARVGYCSPKKAMFFKQLSGKRVQCNLCPRNCVVGDGSRGFCRVRENRGGEYYTLVHSNPCAVHIDPIEKKPLFHFIPGTTALSIATAGCNFTCKNCQNYDISQARPDDTMNFELGPAAVVALAIRYETPTIAYTYTEPTVFYEYMLETAMEARQRGVFNIYHSNGYIEQAALGELVKYLDGANVDLKGITDTFYKDITGGTLNPVLESLKTLKKKGVWLEITNLVIPTKNDSDSAIKELCSWVRSELGSDTPLHFSRFYPQYKLQNLPPTPVETLKKAADIAHAAGLHYVYIGNVPGVAEENTYCPRCGKTIIGRTGYQVHTYKIKNSKCEFCNNQIAGMWE